MAQAPLALSDVYHWFGGDLGVASSGDLAGVQTNTRSQQRVVRRLMTNPGEYLPHPTYGAGLGRYVGASATDAEIIGLILGQMRLEASVAQNPAPQVTLQRIPNGLTVSVAYQSLPDRQPVALKFDVTN